MATVQLRFTLLSALFPVKLNNLTGKLLGATYLKSFEKDSFYQPVRSIEKIIRRKFLDMWGSSWALDQKIYLCYNYQADHSVSIELTPGDKYVSPKFSTLLDKGLNHVIQNCREYLAENSFSSGFALESERLIKDTERAAFKGKIIEEVNDLFNEYEEIIFVPAGRAVLTVLTEEIAALNSRKVDFLTREFAAKVSNIKPLFSKSLRLS